MAYEVNIKLDVCASTCLEPARKSMAYEVNIKSDVCASKALTDARARRKTLYGEAC